jgi:2-polyprenyl-3-methyl-5-hydroxy-6-metoxy-1,4-benzoquinol methylase
VTEKSASEAALQSPDNIRIGSYDPLVCCLCGAREATTLLEGLTGRGMTSDSRIVRRNLKKVQCAACGLVRDGLPFSASELERHYSANYTLNVAQSGEEHFFYSASGAMARSRLLRDWILALKPETKWRTGMRVLEVGCGQGSLLSQLRGTFPSAHFYGIDLSADAVALANTKGLNVRQGGLETLAGEEYDVVIAFGVLEHVPNPQIFLAQVRALLSDEGEAIVGQPMQNVPSYDIFFVDHLHHFTTDHVRFLAEKTGFAEIGHLAGHPSIQNFSLHHLRKSKRRPVSDATTLPSASASKCAEAIRTYKSIFSALDDSLARLKDKDDERIAVFGTGEVFTLLYTYSSLHTVKIVCGLDDNVDRRANHHWPFPVLSPDQAKAFGASTILLCVNPMYNRLLLDRISELELDPLRVLYMSDKLEQGWLSAPMSVSPLAQMAEATGGTLG